MCLDEANRMSKCDAWLGYGSKEGGTVMEARASKTESMRGGVYRIAAAIPACCYWNMEQTRVTIYSVCIGYS